MLLTVLANEVQPFIRYDLGDCVRFFTDACPCESPFRSFQMEGRQATLVRVDDVALSPLVFDLEHEHAQRIQLVQASEEISAPQPRSPEDLRLRHKADLRR